MQMHDVRNYIQSLTWSIENIENYFETQIDSMVNNSTHKKSDDEKKFSEEKIKNIQNSFNEFKKNLKKKPNIEQNNNYNKIDLNSQINFSYNIFKEYQNNNNSNEMESPIKESHNNNIEIKKFDQKLGINKQEKKLKTKISKKFPHKENFPLKSKKHQKIVKNQDINLDISFELASVQNDNSIDKSIEEDQESYNKNNDKIVHHNDDSNIQSKESQIQHSKEYNNKINSLINYSKNPEELLNVIKFINYKINFLQHIDLTFEQNYDIKLSQIEPDEILSQVSKILKILMINKSNQVVVSLNSKFSIIQFDIHMFKYLICQSVIKLHQKKYRNLKIFILFDKEQNQEQIKSKSQQKISIKIVIEKQLKIKKFDFVKSYIFENLIKHLGTKVTQTQTFNVETLTHTLIIKIPINKEVLSNTEQDPSDFLFSQKVIIQDDKVTVMESDPKLIIQSDKQVQLHENVAFINVDDEINIQSMHALIFARQDIKLNCCSDGRELVESLMSVWGQTVSQAAKEGGQPVRVVVLLDHVLDGNTGLEAYHEAKLHLTKFNLDILWVLVSSTEDDRTLNKYRQEGFQFIQKPLTAVKARELIAQIYNTKID